MKAILAVLGLSLGLITVSTPCEAGLFRLESETLAAARNGDDLKFQLPAYEFLSANYVSSSRDLELNSDFSLFADPTQSSQQLNVHLLNLMFTPIPEIMSVTVGRNFDMQRSIRPTTIDNVALDFFLFQQQVRMGILAGREHHLDLGTWNPSSTLMGGYLSFVSAGLFPFYVKGKFQHREFDRPNDRIQNLLQLAAQKPFQGGWSPEFLADTEIDVPTQHLNRLEGGFNLYPTYRSTLRWRAETYELKPADGIEQPIFSIFSQGRLYETSIQGEYQFDARFSAGISVAYDNYLLQVQDADRTDGVKVEADGRFKYRSGMIRPALYILRSYGGEVYGGRIIFTQRITDSLEMAEAFDVAYYRKITLSNRAAINSQAELNQTITRQLRLTVGAELNSNNNLTYDVRAFTALKYLLWTET